MTLYCPHQQQECEHIFADMMSCMSHLRVVSSSNVSNGYTEQQSWRRTIKENTNKKIRCLNKHIKSYILVKGDYKGLCDMSRVIKPWPIQPLDRAGKYLPPAASILSSKVLDVDHRLSALQSLSRVLRLERKKHKWQKQLMKLLTNWLIFISWRTEIRLHFNI